MKVLAETYLDYDPNPSSPLYHYCSTKVLLSIIENSCIWLSDAAKTNDLTENQWLFANIRRMLTNVYGSLADNYDAVFLAKAIKIANVVIDNFEKGKAPVVQTIKSYLTCFSENGDLLSQWRAYGNDGKGVAIGFNPTFFSFFNSRPGYAFVKVIYEQDTTDKFLYSALRTSLQNCLDSYMNTSDDVDTRLMHLKIDIALMINEIYQEGYLFKNTFFHEEREWRVFRRIDQNNLNDSDGVDDYGYAEFLEGIFVDNLNNVGSFSRSKLKFRHTDFDIRSYMELGFERCKKEIIEEIILGPKCSISPLDLKILLQKNGYIDDVVSAKISIKKSGAPYI